MPIYSTQIFVPGLGDSQPGNITLPGSGAAVPAGLDAVLEYNGLFLNIKKNVDRYKVTSMDGLWDADVRDIRDPNTDDDGETPYNSFYGGRTIVISGTIQTYTVAKLRDMQQALRAAFADIRNEYPLHFRTGNYITDHIINCKKIAPITGIEQQESFSVSRDFQVSLRASNPRFLSYYSKFLDITPDIPTATETQIAVAENIGNFPAQPVFQIWGQVSAGCTIINGDTNQSFTINGYISPGDYVIFDPAKKSLKNSSGLNLWKYLADDSDYMTFQGLTNTTDGNNNLFYVGDASRIQISWRDTWI